MKWTTEEVNYLLANRHRKSIEAMAFELNRTYASVLTKLHKLGFIQIPSKAKYRGCEEDCFNCKYEECLKPDAQCYEGDGSHRKKGKK